MRMMAAVISLGVLLALLIAITSSWMDFTSQSIALWSLWFFWVTGGFVTIIWTTHRQMTLWHEAWLAATEANKRLQAELDALRESRQ